MDPHTPPQKEVGLFKLNVANKHEEEPSKPKKGRGSHEGVARKRGGAGEDGHVPDLR